MATPPFNIRFDRSENRPLIPPTSSKHAVPGQYRSSSRITTDNDYPTFFMNGQNKLTRVSDDLGAYFRLDLSVKRINDIQGWLWMCGRPVKARPLHRQEVLGRRIVLTEQCDLHLFSHSDIIYVKPLPTYLLDHEVWTCYLNEERRTMQNLRKDAAGFLLSYVWLVRSPVDYLIAKEHHLLPSFLTWQDWKRIAADFVDSEDIALDLLRSVNPRYQFGELRLGRVNAIYRVAPRLFFRHFVRGYLYGYNRYVPFFRRNFGWVIAAFGFFSLILSAMQVGTQVPPLQQSFAFQDASYGFVVFSCVLVALLLALLAGIFAATFFFNMVAAAHHARRERIRRARGGTNYRLSGRKTG